MSSSNLNESALLAEIKDTETIVKVFTNKFYKGNVIQMMKDLSKNDLTDASHDLHKAHKAHEADKFVSSDKRDSKRKFTEVDDSADIVGFTV